MEENLNDSCSKTVAEEKIKYLISITGLLDEETSLIEANYHCVPVFLNSIRDKCSWLLRSKCVGCSPEKVKYGGNGSPTNSDCLSDVENTNISPCSFNSVKSVTVPSSKFMKRRNTSGSRESKNSSSCELPESVEALIPQKLNLSETPKSERVVQKFNLGCESYGKRRGIKKNHHAQVGNLSTTPVLNSAPAPDISNIDLFPPVGSVCEVLTKSTRRITPTPVCRQNGENLRFSRALSTIPANRVWNNALFSNIPLQDERDPKLTGEREMLKKTRCAIEVRSSPEPKVAPTVGANTPTVEDPDPPPVQPDRSQVSASGKLDMLADAYCHCLKNGLVPNVAGEIYFMFQILTSSGKVREMADENSVLGTVHNCVYFAVYVLNQQRDFLNVLDGSTLKTLAEIPYLSDFSKELFRFVKTTYDKHLATKVPKSLPVPQVFFQVDTDNRSNFPNDITFHSFRKQRDMFYELLREWQHQTTVDYSFHPQFSRKVQHLISIGSEAINYVHLARLLQSQLIASCLGTSESVESYSGALGDIKRSFPDRIEKLESRFVSPSKSGGNGPSSFYGIQVFFCEFIRAASSVSLNQHLLDILASKILELNDHEFVHLTSESDNRDESLCEYSSVLNTLRLLAKFFGYLVYTPYKNTNSMPRKLVTFQSALRSCSKPILDIGNILQNALRRKTLILTVPWLVDYLGMMDPIAMSLDYNKEIFYILVEIYQGKFQRHISANNLMFLKLVIGWLFDSQNFPQQLIFSQNPSRDAKGESCTSKEGMDTSLEVHRQLMYSCCPHLTELKFLLDDYMNGIKPTRDVRKIKPVPTSPVSSTGFSDHLLEQQLEENFFLLHSPSLKKTVEFVADRIASRIIQHVRKEVQAMKLITVLAVYEDPEFPLSKKTVENKEAIAKIVNRETDLLCCRAKQMAQCLSESKCLGEIEKIIPQLIPEDTKESVINICCHISARIAINKVMEWSELNITAEYIAPDIKNKVEHPLKDSAAVLPSLHCSGNQLVSNKQGIPAESLTALRNIAASIHTGKQDVSINEILNLLTCIKSLCAEEKGIGILKTIVILTVDIVLSLIARLPWLCSDEIISVFVSFWTAISPGILAVDEILCSRNVQVLFENGDSSLSWCFFKLLLEQLLMQSLFTPDEFQSCAQSLSSAKLNRSSWERFAVCVQSVVEEFVSSKADCTELPAVPDATLFGLNNEIPV